MALYKSIIKSFFFYLVVPLWMYLSGATGFAGQTGFASGRRWATGFAIGAGSRVAPHDPVAPIVGDGSQVGQPQRGTEPDGLASKTAG